MANKELLEIYKKRKRIMRCLITDFKKELLFGDCFFEDGLSRYYPCVGARIKVKILGMFWVTYKQFKKK